MRVQRPPSAGYRVAEQLRYRGQRLRGEVLRVRIIAAGGRCGRGLVVEEGVSFKRPLHAGLQLGNGVVLGRHTRLDVPWGGRLAIADGAKLTGYTTVAASHRVEIGAGAQIAEQCSIRDADHQILAGSDMASAPLVTEAVIIGAGAWVGRGVAVLRGSSIGCGAVVGANSVVRGEVPSGAIAVGAPARVVRYR